MKQWVTKSCVADVGQIATRYQISELFAEILGKRGLHSWTEMDQYLFEDMGDVPDSMAMSGMEEAVFLLSSKIKEGKLIRVIGDYDVDGVMATFILVRGIALLGGTVSYRIPHRKRDGYGMRAYMADEAMAAGVDTIITCDNGISAMDAVEHAKELGMTVVITDHHEVPVIDGVEQIPPADVVIDPKQSTCEYPFKDLCGAAIAYKLIEQLMQVWNKTSGNDYRDILEDLLVFASVATVCDVVPLHLENRRIVKCGLKRISQVDNIGLQSLIRFMDFHREINAGDFGFRIGPCINAAGRLDDATKGLELFLENDPERAGCIAKELITLNEQRKQMTSQAFEKAVEEIDHENIPKVLVVYLPDCHESIAGIVAGRLREKYYRPVYVITKGEGVLKGSGRSIEGYHMQQSLLACRSHLVEFGGHALAAGFSLREEQLEDFKKAIYDSCRLTEEDFVEKLYFDKVVSLEQLDHTLVKQLQYLEPVGADNPGAVFVLQDVEIVSVRMCGKENHIAQVFLKEHNKRYRAVDFQALHVLYPAILDRYGESAWQALTTSKENGYKIHLMVVVQIDEQYGSLQISILDAK